MMLEAIIAQPHQAYVGLLYANSLFNFGDNCYSIQSNNPQDWPDGCTTQVPPNDDLLIRIK